MTRTLSTETEINRRKTMRREREKDAKKWQEEEEVGTWTPETQQCTNSWLWLSLSCENHTSAGFCEGISSCLLDFRLLRRDFLSLSNCSEVLVHVLNATINRPHKINRTLLKLFNSSAVFHSLFNNNRRRSDFISGAPKRVFVKRS